MKKFEAFEETFQESENLSKRFIKWLMSKKGWNCIFNEQEFFWILRKKSLETSGFFRNWWYRKLVFEWIKFGSIINLCSSILEYQVINA